MLANPPTLIEYDKLRFLISDAPSSSNLPLYLKEFEKHGVTDVVRLCTPTYPTAPLAEKGIQVHELPFGDGEPPPAHIVAAWKKLYEQRFYSPDSAGTTPTIAVHCVAGLGRAPVLVALAMVDRGAEALDAIEAIRKKRKGAFNSKQLEYVEKYAKQHRSKNCQIS